MRIQGREKIVLFSFLTFVLGKVADSAFWAVACSAVF